MNLRLIVAIAVCIPLAGCAWLKGIFNPEPEDPLSSACKPAVQKSGTTFKWGGLELPIKAITTVKIGAIEWNPKDVQAISDAVLAMSESRLKQCVYVGAAMRLKPQPTFEQLMLVKASFDEEDKRANTLQLALATSTSVDEILAAAKKLSEATVLSHQVTTTAVAPKPDLPKPEAPKVPTPPSQPPSSPASAPAPSTPASAVPGTNAPKASLETEPPLTVAALQTEVRKQVDELKGDIAELKAQLRGMVNAPGQRQFPLSGFKHGGATLSPDMQSKLDSQMAALLEAMPATNVTSVAVVGYADPSGAYVHNVNIGLKRAIAVATYLARSFENRAKVNLITSGGVLRNDPDARRVDVFVSREQTQQVVVRA